MVKWRWPDGFVCPECGGRRHSLVKTRALYQYTTCRRQTSLTAGTIFAATKLSLRSWFRALYHPTQSKQGISSLELGRRLGVTQSTAWTVKHKLKQVMMERDAKKRLIGRLEMDDAYLGGQRSGGKRGRGAAGKTPIVATSRSAPARATKPSSRLPSSGSTPLSATSRRRSSAPIGRSATSTSRAIWPSSSTASTAATIWPPCSPGSAGLPCAPRSCLTSPQIG